MRTHARRLPSPHNTTPRLKTLVLGGNGLLGSNVIAELTRRGHEVCALVRPGVSWPDRGTWRVQLMEGNALSDADLCRALSGCEAVVNCIGTTNPALRRYESYLPANRDLCRTLIAAMDRCGVRTLVHVSTANTIGCGQPSCLATETAPPVEPFASSLYARSKAEGEQLILEAAHRRPEGHIVVVNPGYIVGPYDSRPTSGRMILAAYRRRLMAMPDGGKSFVHAQAAATAIVNALTMGRNGQRYLLTGPNLSLREFYTIVARTEGYRQRTLVLPNPLVKAAGRVGDAMRRLGISTSLSTNNVQQLMAHEYYDSTLAQTELQLPILPVADAVSSFVAWWAAHHPSHRFAHRPQPKNHITS